MSWKGTATLIYAPFLFVEGSAAYLFFAVYASDGSVGRIGYATASSVTGTYTDSGAAILSPGTAGTWDSLRVGEACVLHEDGLWKVWYMGDKATYQENEKIGYAEGTALASLTKSASNPVLDWGTSGAWDDALVADPHVFRANGYLWMMYAGAGDSNPATSASQGFAYSLDGVTWTRYASNPVLDPGTSGAWDDTWAFRGGIWAEDGLVGGTYTGYPGGALTGSKGGNFRLTITAPGGSTALDDLTDVTITSAATDDTLRYDGAVWVNDNRRWEPVTTDPGTCPEIVFTSTDIVMTWETY